MKTIIITATVAAVAAVGLAAPAAATPDTQCNYVAALWMACGDEQPQPICEFEDGNTDGSACLWVDPDTGDVWRVDSSNYSDPNCKDICRGA